MITCPLCHKPVYKDDDSPILITIEDDDQVSNFWCHTKVNTKRGWVRHYYRRIFEKLNVTDWVSAIIPPYFFLYNPSIQKVQVELLHSNRQTIYQSICKQEDLPKLYQRFANLKAFI